MSSSERTYGGVSMSERKAQRRADLLEAALELVGEGGGPAVTVRSVCRVAGLTDRYFYESFANRDELLVALFNQAINEIFDLTSSAIAQIEGTRRDRARAAALALLTFMENDPRKARLVFREPLSESALIEAGFHEASGLTQVLAHSFASEGSGSRRAMSAIARAGALATLLMTYQVGALRAAPEELVEFCAEIIAPD